MAEEVHGFGPDIIPHNTSVDEDNDIPMCSPHPVLDLTQDKFFGVGIVGDDVAR